MKRINIEASSAMERWLEMWRTDRDRWNALVARAVRYLPIETRTVRRDPSSGLAALADVTVAEVVLRGTAPELVAERRHEVRSYPTRVLANAIVTRAWRNGPIEDLHAGTRNVGPPLEHCRITLRDCRAVLRRTLSGMVDAMCGLTRFDGDPAGRAWEDQVLPYHLADPLSAMAGFLVPPDTSWSLTDHTCQIRLTGSEHEAALPVRLPD